MVTQGRAEFSSWPNLPTDTLYVASKLCYFVYFKFNWIANIYKSGFVASLEISQGLVALGLNFYLAT